VDRLDSRPRVRGNLTVVELDGEAVIFDERNGHLHRLNPTAALIFSRLDGSSTVDELARELGEAFSRPVSEIESQLRSLVFQFGESHLLVGTEPERSEIDPRPVDEREPTRERKPGSS
jgi:Coenzyme PQQ synthesis protein D (PqqD)